LPTINFTNTFKAKAPKDEGGPVPITGLAVHEGLYHNNTIEVPGAEMKNIAETLRGVPLLKDHENSVDNIVGKVNMAEPTDDNGTYAVKYSAIVDHDDPIASKIQKGLIQNVSIGFHFTPICSECGEDFRKCGHWFDEAHIIAKDISCHELSLVAIGADTSTTVQVDSAFIAELKANKEKITREDDIMKEKIDESKKENEELKSRLEELESENKELSKLPDKINELEAELKEKTDKSIEYSEALKIKDETIKDLEEELEELKATVEEYKAKEERFACEEIVRAEIEKGITEKANFEDRVEELLTYSKEAREAVKELVEKFRAPKPSKEQVTKEAPFEAQEPDIKSPEFRRQVFMSMLKD